MGYSRREPAAPKRVPSRRTPAADQVEALFKLFKQRRNIRGVVSPRAVHGNDNLALSVCQPCGNRRGLTEVALEAQHLEPGFRFVEAGKDAIRSVGAAVIHEDELVALSQRVQHGAYLVDQRLQV